MSCDRPRKKLTDGAEEYPRAISMTIRVKRTNKTPRRRKKLNYKKTFNKMSNESDNH